MPLKVTPRVDGRYWAAIMLASMLGTNFGDFFPDVLRLDVAKSLTCLALLFVTVHTADRWLPVRSETFYWLSILVVRAAATSIADFSVDYLRLGYTPIAIGALFVLLLLVAVQDRLVENESQHHRLPKMSMLYWPTMLTAGSLGTALGDGVGHAFGPVVIGVPVSAAISSIILILVLSVRRMTPPPIAANYWIAIVIVRWWGTNFGDIFKHITSFAVSMSVTAAAMIAMLVFWRGKDRTESKRSAH